MAKINEIGDTEKGQYMLGRLRGRKFKKDGFQKGNEIGRYAEKSRENATQKIKNVDGVDHMVYSPYKYDRLTNSHANGWHDEMHKNESKNMKQEIRLNESELHNLIEGAVKQLVMEYLPYEGGKVAARRLQQGDTGAFEKYMDYGLNNGWTNDDMKDFQTGIETGPSVIENGNDYDEDFEDLNDGPINNAVDGSLEDDIAFEGKRAVKVSESQLFDIIKESVNILLKEGQGWNLFKNTYKDIKNGEFDDSLMKGDYPENDEEYRSDRKNYINHTGMYADEPYYDGEGHYQYNNTLGDNKKVNNGFFGKLGRRAGAFGSEMALKARRNKLNR